MAPAAQVRRAFRLPVCAAMVMQKNEPHICCPAHGRWQWYICRVSHCMYHSSAAGSGGSGGVSMMTAPAAGNSTATDSSSEGGGP